MKEPDEGQRVAIVGAFFLLLFALSITPIQSYDYFWHLATGHWILDNGSLPESDPFSLSSDDSRWVDGEWLFQIGAAVVDGVLGDTGASIVRAFSVAMIFSIGLAGLLRHAAPFAALFVVAVSLWGADHRLTTRPETIATLLMVAALWILLERRPDGWGIGAYAALTIVWMANHPSALLAPAIAGLVLTGRLFAGERGREMQLRLAMCVASGVALLVNPWGLEGIAAPLRLARLVGSGAFVNIEWTPTRLVDFPLVFIVPLAGAVLFGLTNKWKPEAARLLVFAFLAFLAIRYVRNHGFFFAAVPFVVAPLLPTGMRSWVRSVVSAGTVLLLCGLLWKHGGLRTGVDDAQFPVASVTHLKDLGLEGHIYNPDQLGGYLVWRFYPDRRVLTDGRNELHVSYIEEYAKARLDQRGWHELLEKYEIVLAVDEYHRETIDVVDAATGERRKSPASLIYFPRREWALLGFDDVAMVFARRDSFDEDIIEAIEFRTLVPDGAVPVTDFSPETISTARGEVGRARELFGQQESVERIADMLGRIASGRDEVEEGEEKGEASLP